MPKDLQTCSRRPDIAERDGQALNTSPDIPVLLASMQCAPRTPLFSSVSRDQVQGSSHEF